MNTLRKILMMVLLIAVVFFAGFLSGCMTIKGLASDTEELAGAINRGLEPAQENRREAQLDRAAQLVIETKKGIGSSN